MSDCGEWYAGRGGTIIGEKRLDCRVVRGIHFKRAKVVFANNEGDGLRPLAIRKGHVCGELVPREHPGH